MTDPAVIRYSPAPDVPFLGSTETFWNYDSRNQAAAAGQSLVRGHISAHIGHIPAGKLPVLMQSDGVTPVGATIQWDKIASDTPDGSIVGMSYRMMLPETLSTLGSFKTYKWGLATATRNTTPNVTVSQITANTNLQVKVRGPDFGSDTFTVSLNDILNNFTGGLAPQNWGSSYPLGGWEITEQGPVITSLQAWRFLKRDSDGASHRWVRVDFFWSFLSATSGNIASFGIVRVSHPNILGAHPSGTVGATVSGTVGGTWSYPLWFNGIFDLYNGSSLLTAPDFVGSVGGPNDTATQTLAASGLTVSGTTMTGLTGLVGALYYQVTSTGAVPGGMTSGSVYCYDGSGHWYNNRNDMADGINGISFTSAGTGNITFTALANVAHGAGFVMRTTDGSEEPIWVGTSARPTKVDRAADLTYRLRGARITFPRDPTVVITAQASDVTFPSGRPNGYLPIPFDINTTGDGRNDLRIGEQDALNTMAMYLSQNAETQRQVRSLAYCWADYQALFLDETGGRRTVGIGTNYPNMPPSQADGLNYLCNEGNGGFLAQRSNGYLYRYASMVDGSHMPTFGKGPFMHWGDDIFLEMVFNQVGSLAMAYGRDITAPSSTTYRSVFNNSSPQARGPGWALHIGLYARKLAPNQHPESQHYRDCIKNSAAAYADFAANNPANAKTLGICIPQMNTTDSSNSHQLWMQHIYNGAVLMGYWMAMDTGWASGVDAVAYKNLCNMYLPEYGGRMFDAAQANWYYTTDGTLANCYSSIATMWANSLEQHTQTPLTYPDYWSSAGGQAMNQEDTSYFMFNGTNAGVTDWCAFPTMTWEMADVCGIANARLVRERYRARQNRNGGFVPAPYLQHAPLSWAT